MTKTEHVIARGTERETRLKPGTAVLPLIWSAMFDEGFFPNPDEFDATRPFENYFHFGYGLHECLGKHVGMVMIPEMVRQVILLPGVEVRSAVEFGKAYPQRYLVDQGIGVS
ncbi:MAG: cytochrome P450 [bacterium]|nr:cytochrome P450 [bacterium]